MEKFTEQFVASEKIEKIEYELSVRAYGVLRAHVKAPNDLERLRKYSMLTIRELRKFRGCGPVTAREIMTTFQEHGICQDMEFKSDQELLKKIQELKANQIPGRCENCLHLAGRRSSFHGEEYGTCTKNAFVLRRLNEFCSDFQPVEKTANE